MKPLKETEFTSVDNIVPDRPSSLAGLLAPIQCVLESIPNGGELRLTGFDVGEVLRILAVTCESEQPSTLLVLNRPGTSLPQIRCVSSDQALFHMEESHPIHWVVRVDGSIEETDSNAILGALAQGICPLDAEIRATSVIKVLNGGVILVRSRSLDQLLLIAARMLRSYVKVQCKGRSVDITHPELGFMHALLNLSGTFTLRPIETEIYSTWIDIGVSTCPKRTIEAANQSVIYDFIGNSWHGDF